MNIRRYLLLFGAVLLVAFLLILVFKNPIYTEAHLKEIKLIGSSQVGLSYSDYSSDFMYSSYKFNGDTTITNIIIKLKNKDIVIENAYFGGFINDTLCVTFDLQDFGYLWKIERGKLDSLQKFYDLKAYDFELNTFKPGIHKDNYGIYFIENQNFSFLNLKDSIVLQLLNCNDFGEDYSEISSFDLNKNVGIFCLKKEVFNGSHLYDFYLHDFEKNSKLFICKTPRTNHLTYEPLIRYINDTLALASFNLDDNSLLLRIDLVKNKIVETCNLNNRKVINITTDKISNISLTLLNEERRDSLSINSNNMEEGMYGGINRVFRIVCVNA